MFGTKVDLSNIKNFTESIKAVKYLMKEKKWEEASHIIEQTKQKEKEETERTIGALEIQGLSPDDLHREKSLLMQGFDNNIEIIKKLETSITEIQKKTHFSPESIKKYSDAIKSIQTLILLREWDKARKSISEIKDAEKKGLDNLFARLEAEGKTFYSKTEKRKQLQAYNKKEKELNKLLAKLESKEYKHNEKMLRQKFKIRFQKIKGEIHFLTKTGKAQQALNVLKGFLENNKDKAIVIKFYNKEKGSVLKSIEKQKIVEEKKITKNLRQEAMKLAGQTVNLTGEDEEINQKRSFIETIKKHINVYHTLKENIRKKQLLDEVTILIQGNQEVNDEITEKRLANIHKGLVKELYSEQLEGYNLYGKILGADRISGDTFGLHEGNNKINLFLGDATGHGLKAGLIITLLTRLFDKHVKKKNIRELLFEINNGLKQELKSRNFITGILFEVDRTNISYVTYVGFGHEPMLVYRKETKNIESFIPGGLAAGIRKITSLDQIKEKSIKLNDGDILLTYSDGIIEAKSPIGEFYGLERFKQSFLEVSAIGLPPRKIYKHLLDRLALFRGGTSFNDDATIMLLQRNADKDAQNKDSKFLQTLQSKEKLHKKDLTRLSGKNKMEIQKEMQKIRHEKELNLILSNLKKLYHIGEFLSLKQEAIRYIKEGWVHKDINFYLKKAIDNESKYKIGLKNKKISNRYNLLEQLYKKGDYDTVISEIEEIISKDGEI